MHSLKTLNMIGPAGVTCQPLPNQPKEQTYVACTGAHSLLWAGQAFFKDVKK